MSALQTLLGILAGGGDSSGGPMSETLGLPNPKKIPPSKVTLDPNLDEALRVIYGGGGAGPASSPGGPAPASSGGGGIGGFLHNLAGHVVPGAAEQHAMEIEQRGQIANQMEKARMLSEIIQAKRAEAIMQHQQTMEALAGRKETEAERQHQAGETQRQNEQAQRDTQFQTRMDMLGKQLEAGQEKSTQQQQEFDRRQTESERANRAREANESTRTAAMIQNMTRKQDEPTQGEKNRASLAQNLKENTDQLEEIVNRRPDLFGPMAGRLTRLKQLVGSNDPDVAAIQQIKENLGLVVQSSHGMRAYRGVEAAANSILNGMHSGPDGIRSAINTSRKSAETFEADVAGSRGQTVKQFEAPNRKARGQAPQGGTSNDPLGLFNK